MVAVTGAGLGLPSLMLHPYRLEGQTLSDYAREHQAIDWMKNVTVEHAFLGTKCIWGEHLDQKTPYIAMKMNTIGHVFSPLLHFSFSE